MAFTVVIFTRGVVQAQFIETQTFELAIQSMRAESKEHTVTIWRNVDNRMLVLRYGVI